MPGPVVVADDGAERAAHVVRVIKALRRDVMVIVRVRYAADAAGLEADGADLVVTEEIEASASLAARVSRHYGHATDQAVVGAQGVRRFHAADRAPAGAS